MQVYLETYGCQMNEYDTELIHAILRQGGFRLTGEIGEAQVVLLNTCAIRETAERRICDRVRSIRRQHRRHLVVGILGCMAQHLREQLFNLDGAPLAKHGDRHRGLVTGGIDLLVGPDNYRKLPALIRQACDPAGNGERGVAVELSEYETYSDICPERVEGVNAWIAIMRGCDKFCTFCVVPYTRGRERSRSPDSVVQEVEALVGQGYRQVTLLGQNVNSYRFGPCTFAALLRRVAEVPGVLRVRFTSPHPQDFPDELLQAIAEHPKICKHIHLPLQAGSDRILRLMNRRYSRQAFLRLVQRVREVIPGVALSTDVIVGFPTETEAEYRQTCQVMEEVQFDSAFIFKYSHRQGTTAYRRWADDVPEAVKSGRVTELVARQRLISEQRNQQQFIGRMVEVLVEGEAKKSPLQLMGRTDDNRVVVFPRGAASAGDLITVQVSAATPHTLLGEMVSGVLSSRPNSSSAFVARCSMKPHGPFGVVRGTHQRAGLHIPKPYL